MSRGGLRHGWAHVPVESCFSLSSWGHFQEAQMWQGETDFDDSFEWEFSEDACALKFTRDGREWSQRIRLTWSACAFGGRRSWFLCPNCGRRVGRLYLPCTVWDRGERVHTFLCRHCYKLTYLQRQSRDQYWTLNHRAERLERWFTYEPNEGAFYPLKWQRRKAFDKWVDRYEETIARANACGVGAMAKLLKRVRGSY